MKGTPTRRIVSKRTVKSFWNCPYCNRTHIDGLVDYCPGCGVHKPDYTKYGLDRNNIVEVSKEELAEAGIIHSETGEKRPDWKCGYCNSLNNWGDTNCSSCGSPKSESKEDYFGNVETPKNETKTVSLKHLASEFEVEPIELSDTTSTKIDEVPVDKYVTYAEADARNTEALYRSFNKPKFNFNFNILKYAGIVALILGFIWLIVYLFKPYEVKTKVEGFSWSRSINIEELNTYQYNDWSLPSGARLLYTRNEYKDEIETYQVEEEVTKTRREIVDYDIDYEYEYEDNGDGTQTEYKIEVKTPIYEDVEYTEIETVTKTRTVQVLRTKYYYEIDKWEYDYSSMSSGNDKNPYWNENFTLNNNERISSKTEDYNIYYSNGDVKDSSYNEWMQTDLGDVVTITKCKLGIVYSQTEN